MNGRRLARLAAVAVVVAVLGAAVWMGSLRTGLHMDSARFRPSEAVDFTISVCSSSYLPMRTDDGRPSWQIIDEGGEVVADSSHQVFTLVLRTLTWSPRQCRDALSVAWDQREWNQRPAEGDEVVGRPRRGRPVQPGRYVLVATWGELDPERRTFQIGG